MKAINKTTKKSKKTAVKKTAVKKTVKPVVKMTAKQKSHIKIVRVSDEQGQADKVIVNDAVQPVVAAVVDNGVVMMTPVDTNEQSK